jgi:hypothetical protein
MCSCCHSQIICLFLFSCLCRNEATLRRMVTALQSRSGNLVIRYLVSVATERNNKLYVDVINHKLLVFLVSNKVSPHQVWQKVHALCGGARVSPVAKCIIIFSYCLCIEMRKKRSYIRSMQNYKKTFTQSLHDLYLNIETKFLRFQWNPSPSLPPFHELFAFCDLIHFWVWERN